MERRADGVLHHRHHFGALKTTISPYIVPGDPSSGVLPRISTTPPGEFGQADKRIQAYCYRYCVTDHPDNRIPFPKPDGYDPKQVRAPVRIYDVGWRETFEKFDPIPNRKTDSNNHGPFSTDNIGFNYDYPEASYDRRREILKEHETHQKDGSISSPTIRESRKRSRPRCAAGACRRTSFRTTAAGRTRFMCARRAAWLERSS